MCRCRQAPASLRSCVSLASGSGPYLTDPVSPACRGVWWARDTHPAPAPGCPCNPVLHGNGTRDSPPADVSLGLTHPLPGLHRYYSDLGNWSRRRLPGACRRAVCYGVDHRSWPSGERRGSAGAWRQVAVAWLSRGASRLGCGTGQPRYPRYPPPAIPFAYVTPPVHIMAPRHLHCAFLQP